MKLTVATPLALVVEADDVRHLRAEDETGAFGILPGHADFLTALAVSVASWRDAAGAEHHVALRGGMLAVRGGDTIAIASPEAVAGDDLRRLQGGGARPIPPPPRRGAGGTLAGAASASRRNPQDRALFAVRAVAGSARISWFNRRNGDGGAGVVRPGPPPRDRADHPERLDRAVELRRVRREHWQREGERSIGRNLAMIGVLGWTIVTPTLIGIFGGRWLDRIFDTGIFWSLGLLVAGLALGCWLAWNWMQRE